MRYADARELASIVKEARGDTESLLKGDRAQDRAYVANLGAQEFADRLEARLTAAGWMLLPPGVQRFSLEPYATDELVPDPDGEWVSTGARGPSTLGVTLDMVSRETVIGDTGGTT